MKRETQLRIRSILADWGWLIAILLVVLLAIGGWATYTSLFAGGTTEEVHEEEVWRIETNFAHEATVVQANPVFPNGTVLQNRSTYLTALAPIVNGTYETSYQGQVDDSLSVRVEPTMLIRAEDEEQVYWTNVTAAAPPTETTLEPGESTAVDVSINATAFDQRREAIVETIGGGPGDTTLSVVFSVTASGTVDGEPTQLSFADRVPITVQGDSYSVEQGVGTEESITRQIVTERPIEYGPLMQLGGPILTLVSLLALVLLGIGVWQDAFRLSERDRSFLDYTTERSEFEEWIVSTHVPDSITDREAAEAATVTDVVDFAIDSDVAALEDVDSKAIYAVGSDVTVVYHPPPAVTAPEVTAERGVLGLLRDYFDDVT